MISGYVAQVIVFFLINSILALGLFVTMRSGQFSVGHGAFMGAGAYVSALLTLKANFPLALSIIGGGVAALVFGVLVGTIIGIRLRALFLAVGTLAVGEIFVVVMRMLDITGGPLGLSGVSGGPHMNWIVFFVLIIFLFFVFILDRSPLGKRFAAVREDEKAAASVGINTSLIRIQGFGLGAFITGTGGGLFAHFVGTIQPHDFNILRSIDILVSVIIGGQTSFLGPVLGGGIITILPEALRDFPVDRFVVYGVVILIIMRFLPDGIIREIPFLKRKWEKPDSLDTNV